MKKIDKNELADSFTKNYHKRKTSESDDFDLDAVKAQLKHNERKPEEEAGISNNFLFSTTRKKLFQSIVGSEKNKSSIQIEELLQEMELVASLLHLNEIELVYWSLLLDHHSWQNDEFDTKMLLRITAFQVKTVLNSISEAESYYRKISKGLGDFSTLYNNWHEKTCSIGDSFTLNFSPSLINSQYKKLRQPTQKQKTLNKGERQLQTNDRSKDYNKFVDDLLKLTPPNQMHARPDEEFNINTEKQIPSHPVASEEVKKALPPSISAAQPLDGIGFSLNSAKEGDGLLGSQYLSPRFLFSQDEIRRPVPIPSHLGSFQSQENLDQLIHPLIGLSKFDHLNRMFDSNVI